MIAELTRHLWQSTFFVFAAALLTLAFRGNRAQVRYWLWLSASVKFLLPVALLMSAGSWLQSWVPATHKIAPPIVSFAGEYVAQPFPATLSFVPAASRGTDWIPSILLGLWACGFLTIALIRFRNWRRIRAAVRAGMATDIHASVEVRVSPGLLEPGVVGLLRPILLLPEGIAERLTPSELKAVLAHELCHVRRRDNLFAAIHMIVEAVFWFHPLVWWIGARLVEERERACDEEVLSLGNQPDVYADAILNICKLYVESPLTCVAGVSGASIRRRIEAIMSNPKIQGLNHAKKLLLASAGVFTLAGPIAIGLVISVGNMPAIRAQPPALPVAQTAQTTPVAPAQVAQTREAPAAPKPKFDVASIRPCDPNDRAGGDRGGGGGGRIIDTSPGRIDVHCQTVETLVMIAYVVNGESLANDLSPAVDLPGAPNAEPIRGGPAWAHSDLYTVEAKTDDSVANGPGNLISGLTPAARRMGIMLQALLEDRFQLKTHRGVEPIRVYNLTVAKSGFKLKPMGEGGCTPDPDHTLSAGPAAPGTKPVCTMHTYHIGPNWAFDAAGRSLSEISRPLGHSVLGRPVIDKTGITGLFNVHLEFAHDEDTPGHLPPGLPSPFQPSDIPVAASIFTVLEQQLGLKLVPDKGPHGYIVIDHVERPSEN